MAGWDPSRRAGCRSAAWRGRRVVRLGWFATMPAGLLTATCARGQRTGLLTVPPAHRQSPPHTGEQATWAAMGQAGNRSHTRLCWPPSAGRPARPPRNRDRIHSGLLPVSDLR
jgi:hypothetical protein